MSKASASVGVFPCVFFCSCFYARPPRSARIQCEAWAHQSTHPDINSYQLIPFMICSVNWKAMDKEGIASKIPPLACTKVCLKWIFFPSLLEKKKSIFRSLSCCCGFERMRNTFCWKEQPRCQKVWCGSNRGSRSSGGKSWMETPGRAHREGGTDAGKEVQQIKIKPAEDTSLQCCLDLLLKTGFTPVANTWWAVTLSRVWFSVYY